MRTLVAVLSVIILAAGCGDDDVGGSGSSSELLVLGDAGEHGDWSITVTAVTDVTARDIVQPYEDVSGPYKTFLVEVTGTFNGRTKRASCGSRPSTSEPSWNWSRTNVARWVG